MPAPGGTSMRICVFDLTAYYYGEDHYSHNSRKGPVLTSHDMYSSYLCFLRTARRRWRIRWSPLAAPRDGLQCRGENSLLFAEDSQLQPRRGT
jgi:hypothetical protein